MTTKEVAEFLRIKERKVYDLVAEKQIPCTRVTGKLLFPRALLDRWIARATEFPEADAAALKPIPAVVAGSHDPLLEWALRQSGSGLALLPGGSLDGLERFAAGEAAAAGLHILDGATGEYNVHAVSERAAGLDVVLVEWARRRQGLLVAKGNPLGLGTVEDLDRDGVRVAVREPEAGSRILFHHLLAEAGLAANSLTAAGDPVRSESDLALAIVEGKADAGLGIATAAAQYSLDFVPLWEERYDLAVRRRAYFEAPFQAFLTFCTSEPFRARAAELTGYDVSGFGDVHFNAA